MNALKRKIIIDCDPGQDDAVMLLLAMASREELDILGITTVAGNVPLELTQRNARLMCELAKQPHIPVFAGCERPLAGELITAENVHGSTGIDGAPIHSPAVPLQDQHAVDFIIETLEQAEAASITLVPTGPLTNIGSVFEQRPDLLPKVQEIVLMGGAMREGGNTSPSAEFNILVDPLAAAIVMHCNRPLTIAPLDVTHQVVVTQERLAALRGMKSKVAAATVGMLEYFNRHDAEKYHIEGAPLHDPCTIAYLLAPDLFTGKWCNVEVETTSALTRGHTAVDFWGVTERPPNAKWLYRVNAEGFFNLLIDRLGRYES